MKHNRVIGIDLGTTNSCVGVMDEQQSKVLLQGDSGGDKTTPSCLYYDEQRNEVVVGAGAYAFRGANPSPVSSIKRYMGKDILTPLGRACSLPCNLPPAVARSLTESREERFERFLSRIDAGSEKERERIRKEKTANPPRLWVLDQKTRLEVWIEQIADPKERQRVAADPPLLWLPEELSALIVAEERRCIADTIQREESGRQHEVERAVITHPAYFAADQIEATREAGLLAGLRVVQLLAEPTAAATYYCWKHGLSDGALMVFDLGGGTFDVSILKAQGGNIEVVSTSGNNALGGNEFDAALAHELVRRLKDDPAGYDLDLDLKVQRDRAVFDGLKHLAEKMKKEFSQQEECRLRDNTHCDRAGKPIAIEMSFTRAEFEELIKGIVARCIPKCWEAVARAHRKSSLTLADIDHVLLVGGSTYVPLVREVVQRTFCSAPKPPDVEELLVRAGLDEIGGDDPQEAAQFQEFAREQIRAGVRLQDQAPLLDEPDLCVALGAAICAAEHPIEFVGENAVIAISSPRCCGAPTATIAGTVRGVPPRSVDGAIVRLSSAALGVDEEAPLQDNGSFAFAETPLMDDAVTVFELSVESEEGDVLGESTLSMRCIGERLIRPPGATVTRPYRIKVRHRGIVTNQVLVSSGATLPQIAEHQFGVPDQHGGVVHFVVMQSSRVLKRIEALIDPDMHPGSPIRFRFAIDKNHLMRVTYQIGDESGFAVIEPPGNARPSLEEIRELEHSIVDDAQLLDETKRMTIKNKAQKLRESAQRADKNGDESLLMDLHEELTELAAETAEAGALLDPPWAQFERLVDLCLNDINRLEKKRPDFPVGSLRETVTTLRKKALDAYQRRDQIAYGNLHSELEETEKSVQQELYAALDPPSIARLGVQALRDDAARIEQAAAACRSEFQTRAARAQNEQEKEIALRKAKRCERIEEKAAGVHGQTLDLDDRCHSDPEGVLRDFAKLAAELEEARVELQALSADLGGQLSEGDLHLPTRA